MSSIHASHKANHFTCFRVGYNANFCQFKVIYYVIAFSGFNKTKQMTILSTVGV